MIKPDLWIRRMARNGMLDPFEPEQVSEQEGRRIISYGVSSYGYDARCDRNFRIFHNAHNTLIDPKDFDTRSFVEHQGDECVIPPNSFVLTQTIETFRVPRDVLVVCLGKSTYARCGLIVHTTILEPEWIGQVTLEISNTTPLPARIYAGEGIAQFIFLGADEVCETSYADRRGKYQDQYGVTPARM